MSCEDCLSRREFLMKSTLAVAGVAALVTGCGDGQIGGGFVTAPNIGTLTLKVSTVSALATIGQIALFPTDARVAIERTGASSFLALSTTCTHEGTMINIVNNGTSFECPNHGARYDSAGNVTRQPNSSGSATKLPSFATSYDPTTDILTITAVSVAANLDDD